MSLDSPSPIFEKKHYLYFFSLVAAVLLLLLPARAQDVTAAINGVVTDPSGAAISGAKVTAKDLDRGTVFPATANSDGAYTLPRLPIGRYEIRVEGKGFQSAVKPDVVLQLNQVAKVDFQLQVGDINQTVEVTSAAPILQTESTQLGTVIDSHTATQLPLASRNYNQLTLLTPGATTTSPTAFTGAQSTFNSGRPYINGNREQANEYFLDGMENTEISNNDTAFSPSVDAIQEFNVITQNASAEFGNYMGGIISVSTKAGTNQYHGDAFEFLRNDALNANDWARNLSGSPRLLERWNQFGGSLGGPIKKNKLFFFADYQGSRFDTPATPGAYTVFTTAERSGDFSALLPTVQLKDPRTGIAYVNNRIPTTLISPAASKILNSPLYPQPINGNLVNNQIQTTQTYTNSDQGDARVDWAPTEKDHIFGRYSQQNVLNPTVNSQPLVGNSNNQYPLYQGVIDYTRTISPSFVNDLRGGVNYFPITTGFSNPTGQNLPQVFGIPGSPSTFLPGMEFPQNSNVGGGSGAPAFGNLDAGEVFNDTTIQAEDTVIITHGQHTMRAGFQYFRYREDYFYPSNDGVAGNFVFNGQYTGFAEADFLEGLPASLGIGSTGGGQVGQRYSRYGAFFQDDWRVNQHLTLNLGLRWELNTPVYEVHNRQINFGEFTGAVQLAGQNGNSDALYNQYNGIANFEPRIGLAWTPFDDKTVIRAAWGVSNYLEANGVNNRLTQNPPFNVDRTAAYPYGAGLPVLPGSTLDQGFSSATTPCTLQNVTSTPAGCFSGVTIHMTDPNYRPAVSQQWNFTIQHQFGNSTTAQLAYVGQKTDHLAEISLANQRVLNANGTISDSPYLAGNPDLAYYTGSTVASRTNNPTPGAARLNNTDAIQNYNALQASFQKRLSNGLEFQANYTWSKCMSDAPGYFGKYGDASATLASNGQAFPQNTYNLRGDYGACVYDLEHSVNGFLTYDIPFGHNRMFGKQANGVVNAVLGDWEVNSVFTFHTGFPFSVAAPDVSGTGSGFARANCVAPASYIEKQATANQGGGYQWWDPSSFVAPTSGFGSCGVSVVRGPGFRQVDLSLSKQFFFTEHQNLEFRAEGINFLNSAVIAPATYSTDSTGPRQGVFNQSPLYSARQIQFGLKYNF